VDKTTCGWKTLEISAAKDVIRHGARGAGGKVVTTNQLVASREISTGR
jgi:hypothetical protein